MSQSASGGGELTELALQRLIRAVGPAVGPATARETLAELGIAELRSPAELLRFAEQVMAKGGVFEAVGRALKISALLNGAAPAS